MNILFVGDVFGRPGRECVKKLVPKIRQEFSIDFVVINAENSAGGLGATPDTLRELVNAGAHAMTMGNHTWRKKELIRAIDQFQTLIRPANYPKSAPGKGSVVVTGAKGARLGVLNLIGRVYMDPVDCPFERGAEEVERLRKEADAVLVDFHAEATAEKVAMGWHLDGKASAVVGTHTHVQTADERILPKGTAYITDVGMTGPQDSVIGVRVDIIVPKFLDGLPREFEAAKERPALCGVVINLDEACGKARGIQRVYRELN